MRTRTRATAPAVAAAAPALLLALLLAGCGGGGADDGAGAGATTDDGGPYGMGGGRDDDGTAGDEGAAAATVALGSTDLGEVLVGPDGMTLYLYDPDAQGASTCYDQCAQAWPPLLADDGAPAAGDGVDAALLGTTERTDGGVQVTYDGWPLYYWAQDDAPGDATGQGVNDVWWVLDASGEPIRD
jgi:predicted lipoprotein with Yx(FWY)xxD motif